MKIALTGGIACGKSLVAKFFDELGVRDLDADDVVHELEASGSEAVSAIVARFGPSVLAQDGGIDRKKLAAKVFGRDARCARRDLEAILHPLVRRHLLAFASGNKTETADCALRVAIIPLLFEVHWDSEYDIICCVASTRENQISRMMSTRGYTREEAEARLAAQLPVEEKAAKSHYVIDNNGTAEELKANAKRLVKWLEAKSLGA